MPANWIAVGLGARKGLEAKLVNHRSGKASYLARTVIPCTNELDGLR